MPTEGIKAGELDRRILIRRAIPVDDGLSTNATIAPGTVPTRKDPKRWARKTDVSDAEKISAAQQGVEVTSRFLVRYDSITSALTSEDVIIYGDTVYAVIGIKEARGRRVGIEITTKARPYPPDQLP